MTATLDTVAKKKESPPESAELAAARDVVRRAKEQGLSLTGSDVLLAECFGMLQHISYPNLYRLGLSSR